MEGDFDLLLQNFIHIHFNLAIPFLGMNPKETITDMHKGSLTVMFIIQLFPNPNIGNNLSLIIGIF